MDVMKFQLHNEIIEIDNGCFYSYTTKDNFIVHSYYALISYYRREYLAH